MGIFTRALVVALLVFGGVAEARMVAGVRVPASVRIGADELSLNGASLQERFIFDVAVVSFYATKPISKTADAVRPDGKKHLRFVLLRNLSQAQLHDVVRQGLQMAKGEKVGEIRSDADRFLAALPAVKKGDVMSITYVPGEGTTLRINEQRKITIRDQSFSEAIFSVWLGPSPIDHRVQRNLLDVRTR